MESQKIVTGLDKTGKEVNMNRFLLVMLLVVQSGLTLYSQKLGVPMSAPRVDYNHCFFFGLKAGVNLPRLYYTNPYIDDLPHDFIIKPSVSFFMEFPVSSLVGLDVEFNYQQRGGATTYDYEQQYKVNYQLSASYISLRVPLYFYMPVSPKIRPYLFLSPDAGTAFEGKIRLSQPGLDISESEVDVGASNMNLLYLGVVGGVGLRTTIAISQMTFILRFDTALNWGITDTFSDKEHAESVVSTNTYAYNHQGKRLSRGLEVHVSLGVVPNVKDDVCDHFSTSKRKKVKFEW